MINRNNWRPGRILIYYIWFLQVNHRGRTHISIRNLDHLGLVAASARNWALPGIDAFAPQNPALPKVSHGEALVAMIVNGLGFPQTLHNPQLLR